MHEFHWTPDMINRMGWDDWALFLEQDPDHMAKDGWIELG